MDSQGKVPVPVAAPSSSGLPDVSKITIADAKTPAKELGLSAKTVHADDGIQAHRAVAPAMHVSTTFRYHDDPDKLAAWDNIDPAAPLDSHVYSRETHPNTTRMEAILTSILNGPSLTYSSGLSAFHAMLVHLNPKRIAIGEGYHGCHGVIKIMTRLTGLKVLDLDGDLSELGPGDVIHVETPLNPTGEASNLEYYAEKARKAGAYLSVDSTFAPPPLQDPFVGGADVIMHSGTKYFGGHSDMLCGVLAIHPKHKEWLKPLVADRMIIGSVMGSLEGWLGIRSLRTLELRVLRQSQTATSLVSWLESARAEGGPLAGLISGVKHASLQPEASEEGSWLRKQMPGGWGPVFSLIMKDEDSAKRLPSRLRLFHHATSLGGVESLIEWRAMTDPNINKALLRVSVGVEGFEDLKDDLLQGILSLKD